MDKDKCILELVDYMGEISLRLDSLLGTVHTIQLGLQREKMEKQAIDCMECVGYCVEDIKEIVDCR